MADSFAIRNVFNLGVTLGACFNIKKGKRNAQDNLVSNVVFYIVDWLFSLLLRCDQRAAREQYITSKSYSPMQRMGCDGKTHACFSALNLVAPARIPAVLGFQAFVR